MTRVKIHGNNANERDAFFQSQDLVLGDVSTATCAKRTRSHDKIDQDFLSKRLKSTVNSQRENSPVSSRQHPATKNEKGCGPKPLQSSQHDTTMKENLFKGLRFFFVPNKKTSLISQRSKLFTSYGAEILHDFDKTATQTLLVQKDLDGKKVIDYIKLKTIPLIDKNLPEYIVPFLPRENQSNSSQPNASDSSEDPQNLYHVEKTSHKKVSILDKSTSSGDTRDELDKILDQSRLEHVVESMISDVEDGHETIPKKYRNKPNLDMFACTQPEFENDSNPNQHTIMLLSMLQAYYEKLGEQFRALGYRRAIIALRRQKSLISTTKEAVKLPGIGESIAKKIEEAVSTGTIRKLETAKNDPRSQVLGTFMNIYGVGKIIAQKWYNQGVRTLEDVEKRNDLTKNQRMGLQHYEDFLERMPRDLVKQYYNHAIEPLKTIDQKVETFCMGSYRRGQMDCGDIDIILTKKNAKLSELQNIQAKWLNTLFEQGFAKYSFGGGSQHDKRWLGAVAFNDNKWRRLDILLVQDVSLGAALIYYTGNDIFNRSIRLLASKKGYHLNDEGLWLAKKSDEKKVTELIEAKDEKRIFQILGVPYRLPTERNIH